ncbi:MAG: DUF937 domain-containing protein [Bacteroidia bacterium]|nr:DUF937 domain-containing protein [Bacteroidia bacterium]NNJ56466.1 DUF937 domain-containing protein [Bacteroidia bacterium]
MSDILNQLLGQLGPQGIQAISKQIGADDSQTSNALGGVIPTLLGAMANNSKSQSGANGLLGALDSDHDGSILDDVAGFVGNFNQGPGEGILKHVLGGNQPVVESGLSAKTGLNSSQISNLLKIAAPLIMGYLGRQKRASNNQGFDIGGIADLLGGMTRESDQSTGIDLGDILNVVGGLTGNQTQRSGGIGGLLGKLFGR